MIKPGQDWTEALQEDLTGSFLRILSQNPVNEEERWINEEELRQWIWETILANSELAWGLIQGTITDQEDLAAALEACMTHDEFEALHATQAEAEAGTATKPWMSPLRVKQAIDALVTWGNIQGNLSDQLDLNTALAGKVAVSSLATQAEAEAGTAPDKWMSPLTTAQSIVAMAVLLADKASQAEAETGTDNEKWMTPLRVKQAIDEFAGESGEANTASNVGTGSGVFKTKTGVDFEFKTLIEGTNVTFDTTDPDEIVINADGGGVTEHSALTLDDGTNPHATTKTDVGLANVTNDAQVKAADKASQGEAETGTDNDKWMTPARATDTVAGFQKSTTGTEISFIISRSYNTPGSPATGNITDDLTGARAGNVQKIYHNHSTAPTVPAGWVKLGTADYVESELNIIYAEWISGTRVEYWIVQES